MTATNSSSTTTQPPQPMPKSSSTPQMAPRRCFLKDVCSTFTSNSSRMRNRIRVMGLLSQIVSLSTKNEQQQEDELWILDDGTGTVELQADARMRQIISTKQTTDSIQITPGMTLECLAYFDGSSTTNMVWTLEWCAVISDVDAASLRWLELSSCHHPASSGDDSSKKLEDDTVWGYPCVGGIHGSSDDDGTLANEVVRLLSLQQQEEDDSLSVSDLSLLLEMSEDAMVELLQELQLSGRVYQTETGQYVPLT